MWLLLSIVAALTLILINGVFVAAEFAIARVRRTRLEELAGHGAEAAQRALLVVDHVTEYLAVTQIGITAASLGVGWFGESAFSRLFLVLLPAGHFPIFALHVAAAVLAFLVITTLHVVAGELVPKNLGIHRPEHLLLFLARPLEILHVALRPLHRLFEGLSTWIVRRLGQGGVSQPALSEDELELVLMDSHEEGLITAGEAAIIIRALQFADRHAEEIMIAAPQVAFLSLSHNLEENLEIARKTKHARLPLCRDGLDTVLGVVSMKDVWPELWRDASNVTLERAARPVIKIPRALSQDGILKLLQEGHAQMGVVRDEADQHTLGVVTLEDVLEALVGDVREMPVAGSATSRPQPPATTQLPARLAFVTSADAAPRDRTNEENPE
ncbi:MAG TPA: hemolysin family protein [Polyangiaceae bacterium]|nr:hemolysin family protein [Polyangiaceae bacterium]